MLLASFVFGAWILAMSCGVLCSAASPLQDTLFFQNPTSSAAAADIQATSGGSVVLECEAGGNPTPLIRWMRKGRQIVQGENGLFDDLESLTSSYHGRRTNDLKSILLNRDDLKEEVVPKFDLGLTKSRLFLDCVSGSDAGIYTCVAETDTKKISRDFQLNFDGKLSSDSAAEGKCRKKRFVQDATATARVYLWTMQRVVVEGSDVQLFCRAVGSPTPTITWFDPDNHPIDDSQPNGQYEVLHNGDLLVKDTNWMQNMGLYRCLAENDVGSDEISTFVYPTAAEKSS